MSMLLLVERLALDPYARGSFTSAFVISVKQA